MLVGPWEDERGTFKGGYEKKRYLARRRRERGSQAPVSESGHQELTRCKKRHLKEKKDCHRPRMEYHSPSNKAQILKWGPEKKSFLCQGGGTLDLRSAETRVIRQEL